MRLHAAASHFNKMPCLDGYSGAFLFKGQLSLYDDTRRDTEGSERRIIELAPGTSIPSRRVIDAHGVKYILGHGFDDSALGNVIRTKYIAHEATTLATIRTLSQVCLNTSGTSAYAAKAWVKDSKEIDESSDMVGVHHLHFSTYEAPNVSDIISFGNALHIVRKTMTGAAGTLIVTCDEIPTPNIETATLKTGAYDPITEVMTEVITSVRVLRLRWQSLFEYRDDLAHTFQPEDLQVVVANTSTPAIGSTFVLSDGTYQVDSKMAKPGVWVCKVARHA